MLLSANKHFQSDALPRFAANALPAASCFRPFSDSTITQHHTHKGRHRRKTIDARHRDAIASALPALPEDGESWHIITKGNTPLWLAIPRMIELCGEPIADLKISTLGFGRDFANYLRRETTKHGTIQSYGIVCSHYFRSTSQREFALLATAAGRRLAVIRCHAKVIAATMPSGRAFAIEGSGNLRSCRSIEQMTITADAELTRFHQSWITELLNGAPPDSAFRPIGDHVTAGRNPAAPDDCHE